MKKTITTIFMVLLALIGVHAQDYTVMPENGTAVESLTDITITWDNATTITVDPMMMVGGAKVYMVDGESKTFISDIFCGPAWGNAVTLSLMSATSNAGDYIVEIPDAMFTVDEEVISAFTLYYTIGGIPTSTATFDIQIQDNSLDNIYITVSPCEELLLNESEEVEAPFLIHNIGFNSYVATTYTITITGANTATLTAEKPLENGNYSLHIPKNTFLIDNKVNPALVREFDTSAVHSVTNDTQEVNVYDLNGVQVVNKGDADQLGRLRPGIYIVNGVKKMLRGNR